MPQRQDAAHTFKLVQKDRQFTPHLLVIPTASSVDFPNLDLFFHNVFSLYNGKRFDLGLYEAHTHRAVQFDREGVSYIFCNIHPQMGAVIISLSTPYYATSQAGDIMRLRNVPAGVYRLHVWAENVDAAQLAAFNREALIDEDHTQLDPISLTTSGDIMAQHENKFGKEHIEDPKAVY